MVSLFGLLRIRYEVFSKKFIGFAIAILTIATIWFNHKYFQYESDPHEVLAYDIITQTMPQSVRDFLITNQDFTDIDRTSNSPFRVFSQTRETEASIQSNVSASDSITPDPFDLYAAENLMTRQTLPARIERSFDFRYDPITDSYLDRAVDSEYLFVSDNPNLQAALFLRQISSRTNRVLADDATAFPVVALHGRIRDFVLPYENDYITFISNPEKYADYILIPSIENDYKDFDMVYNVAPGLGTPDIPYRILFDNGVWMVLESVNVHRLAQMTGPLILPEIRSQEPYYSVVVVSNDQSLFSLRNYRRLSSRYNHLQIIPVWNEADGFQWIRWKIAVGRFGNLHDAVSYRATMLPHPEYFYHHHSQIDNRFFQELEDFNPSEQSWSLLFGRYSRETDAMEILELWKEFGIDHLRIEPVENQYLVLAGYYNDFTAAQLLAIYLTQESHQRVSVHELSENNIELPFLVQ